MLWPSDCASASSLVSTESGVGLGVELHKQGVIEALRCRNTRPSNHGDLSQTRYLAVPYN